MDALGKDIRRVSRAFITARVQCRRPQTGDFGPAEPRSHGVATSRQKALSAGLHLIESIMFQKEGIASKYLGAQVASIEIAIILPVDGSEVSEDDGG